MALLAEEQGSVQITAIIKSDLGLKQTNSLQKAETTEREREKQRVKNIKVLAQGSEGLRHRATLSSQGYSRTYADGTTNWNSWHSDMGHIYSAGPVTRGSGVIFLVLYF